MEALKLIIDNPNIAEYAYSVLPLAAVGAISAGVQGVAGILGGVFGSRKRKQEQKAARAELQKRQADYENFDFENAFANLENPYEDLRVSTEAAEFQSQQQQQGLANTLDQLRQSGGGLGAAAVAQALAGQASQNQQQIAADIARQEASNQAMAAQGAMQLQSAEASGAMRVQDLEMNRQETLFGMAQQRSAAADQARQQATQSILGGVGQLAGAAAAFGAAGGFKGNTPAISSQDMIDSNVALARTKPLGIVSGPKISAPLLTRPIGQ